MDVLLALAVGVLYGAGVTLMLRRGYAQFVFGLALVGHGTNLLLFSAGGLTRSVPPIALPGSMAPPAGAADPLAQALILTAIVIGFGVLSFTLLLARRTQEVFGGNDSDRLGEEP